MKNLYGVLYLLNIIYIHDKIFFFFFLIFPDIALDNKTIINHLLDYKLEPMNS